MMPFFGPAANFELPNWLIALLLLVGAVVVALVSDQIITGMVRRLVGSNHVVRSVLDRTRGVVRFGFILLALAIVLPMVPLAPVTTNAIHKFMIAGLILLMGWVALLASNLVADRYVSRLHASDLGARKAVTQVKMLKVIGGGLIITLAIAFALMTFDSVRQFGISLFASAGLAGLAAGIASRSILANLFAGLQLALTQPIRIDDAIVVENEWGTVEELTSTYVVVRLWDLRRLIVPLAYFIEKPFQNWTRESTQILGTVLLHVDYATSARRLREKLMEILKASKLWDGQVGILQVTDATENTVVIRALVSAATADATWDLRCEVREKLIAFMQSEYPGALPRRRNETVLSRPNGHDDAETGLPFAN
jgi:small-conductance mechanosensitive channel